MKPWLPTVAQDLRGGAIPAPAGRALRTDRRSRLEMASDLLDRSMTLLTGDAMISSQRDRPQKATEMSQPISVRTQAARVRALLDELERYPRSDKRAAALRAQVEEEQERLARLRDESVSPRGSREG